MTVPLKVMESTKLTSINITYNTSLTRMKNENGANFQKLAKQTRAKLQSPKHWLQKIVKSSKNDPADQKAGFFNQYMKQLLNNFHDVRFQKCLEMSVCRNYDKCSFCSIEKLQTMECLCHQIKSFYTSF